MTLAHRIHWHVLLFFLASLRGQCRYIQVRDATEDALVLLNTDLKRELSQEQIYRRSLRCIDMLSIDGQFTFKAEQPQLHCALFLIGDPEEFITIEYNFVNIDCLGGDILKVFDGWIIKGEKFPSSMDHLLSTSERYTDICEDGNMQSITRSSQNVAMIFFRVQKPGHGFTLTIRKTPNLFPCNVISQSPSGKFTMIIPHQHRNCSFSIIYPVVMKISDLTLGHFNELQLKKPPPKGCGGAGDFVELLGGTGLDPSNMFPLADLCHSFHGSAQMKIGCDNSVLRMVSSGKFINRVTFEYTQLDRQLERQQGNSVEEVIVKQKQSNLGTDEDEAGLPVSSHMAQLNPRSRTACYHPVLQMKTSMGFGASHTLSQTVVQYLGNSSINKFTAYGETQL